MNSLDAYRDWLLAAILRANGRSPVVVIIEALEAFDEIVLEVPNEQ